MADNLLRKDNIKDNFPLFEEVCRMLEVEMFETKLEEFKIATNHVGRQWLHDLMRDKEKWTRAYDEGGWRYEHQTSNMAESFNSVLKGIRGMPVTAIVSFTFYRLVAWFDERHAKALELRSQGNEWAPKPTWHLDNAKTRAHTHSLHRFNRVEGRYQVTEAGWTTSDGEVRPSRSYVVHLNEFFCACGKPRQFHFPCSHYVAAARHANYSFVNRIPHEFSVDSLIRTWTPRFEPFLSEGQWPPYTGPIYVADHAARWNMRGSRKRTRYKMAM